MDIKTIFTCLIAFLFSAFTTWLVRLYALRKAILDIPNERSSHTTPTPRGGGIAVVLTFCLSILWLRITNTIEPNLTWALIGGGIVIAAIGYCDDVYTIKARWRFALHFAVAIWALYWLGGFSVLDLGTWKISLHWAGSVLAIISIIWCINFYNFMDGIDGLAGSEGIFISLASGIALWLVGAPNSALVLWLLTASIAGFTLWNWPPAKIFLGDVGSGFLGYIFAALALDTINKGFLPIAFWWIIIAVFLCDATFTLVYRVYQGKKWYSAHREHAYQHLTSCGANHKQVTTRIVILNCCVLLPMAFFVLYQPAQSLLLMAASTICLWLIWVWIKSRPISKL